MNKNKEPQNVWQYIAWLERSGRLTPLESATLTNFVNQFEEEVLQTDCGC